MKTEDQAGGKHAHDERAVDKREALFREGVIDQTVYPDDEKREEIGARNGRHLNKRQKVILRMGEERPRKAGQENAPEVFQEHPGRGGAEEEGDMEAVVKKGDEPGEAGGEERKVEYKKAEGHYAEGYAYPAEGVHGDNHPVDKARVRDDAGGKACEKIKAVLAGFERKEEGDEGDESKVELGHGRLADDKEHAREESELSFSEGEGSVFGERGGSAGSAGGGGAEPQWLRAEPHPSG